MFASLASELKPKERILSTPIQELVLELCTYMSYRRSASLRNRVYHRTGSAEFKMRTLNDKIEAVGDAMSRELEARSAEILAEFSFDPETGLATEGCNLTQGYSRS